MADADLGSLDRELASLDNRMRVNIALNPATAMRGGLSPLGASRAQREAEQDVAQYASPEMRAYLAPPSEQPALASVEATPTPA